MVEDAPAHFQDHRAMPFDDGGEGGFIVLVEKSLQQLAIMELAGFKEIKATNTTESAAHVAKRWHDGRDKRKVDLIGAEGDANFDGLQRFLSCVQLLCGEGRLRRYLYSGTKPH